MNASNELLHSTINIFCREFGVEQPKSDNILEWWKDALQQMDKEVIEIIYQTFEQGGSQIIRGMREDLVTRRNELVLAV